MAIEVTQSGVICTRCGKSYGRRKGYYPVSYAVLHKGVGYLPVCKECIDMMYNTYLAQCNDSRTAVRQMCRKLDLFWNDSIYETVSKKNTIHSMMTAYMAKLNSVSCAGKCYDDTLSAEGTLWNFGDIEEVAVEDQKCSVHTEEVAATEESVDQEVQDFWGPGFTPVMYLELEQRRRYWMSKFPDGDIDVGTEALIRQICNLEITINRDRADGKAIDKHVNALNTLLGSASLKPAQRKVDDEEAGVTGTPLGVWLYRYENKRPLPEIDDDLKDVNGLKRYISIWVRGHLAKMVGVKNSYSKMYEDEIDRLRVERPEYNDEDDDALLNDAFGGVDNEQN